MALKMILAGEHARPEDLARFRTEAEAVARLQNPHIVQVYEVGEHQGIPFFSLEFCPGGSLAQQLDGTPWPGDKAARLVEKLARAMSMAHQNHINVWGMVSGELPSLVLRHGGREAAEALKAIAARK